MSRKNYTSPYKNVVDQYPSQLEEYISLDMGGRKNERDICNKSSYYQRRNNPNFICDSSSSYTNNYVVHGSHQKQWSSPRKNDRNKIMVVNSEKSSISSYIHPSMTEDPWIDLMKRIDAIGKSKIALRMKNDINSSSEAMEAVAH